MANVLAAMGEAGCRRICFTDSIGSFGAEAPREDCTARWLVQNPDQDPGSDYGRQKRGCRELMAAFARDHNGDPRFAVLPGVLHSEAVWGGGTTEYALEALLAASKGLEYSCPIDPELKLPMVFVTDLMRGLVALMEADEAALAEPAQGYCIPGLSFSARELFEEITRHRPGFKSSVCLDPNMSKFAQLWPDTLSLAEPMRDLGYSPEVGLAGMVGEVLAAHALRTAESSELFRAVDLDGNGTLEQEELEQSLAALLPPVVVGPDGTRYPRGLRDKLCVELVRLCMEDMDLNKDGRISWEEFQSWSRSNTLKDMVEGFIEQFHKQRTSQPFS